MYICLTSVCLHGSVHFSWEPETYSLIKLRMTFPSAAEVCFPVWHRFVLASCDCWEKRGHYDCGSLIHPPASGGSNETVSLRRRRQQTNNKQSSVKREIYTLSAAFSIFPFTGTIDKNWGHIHIDLSPGPGFALAATQHVGRWHTCNHGFLLDLFIWTEYFGS